MFEIVEINKIATDLVARYSKSFLDKLSELSRAQANSIGAFVGSGLTSLTCEQLRRIARIKTFLSGDEPVLFSDLYVNLRLLSGGKEIRDDDLISDLDRNSRYVVLGTAGSGKSMLMRYIIMVLSTQSNKVPILVELRHYNSQESDELFDFVYEITHATQTVSRDLFVSLLKRGGFVFLLDGFDEVDFSRRPKLEKQIEKFLERFPHNSYVVTSRPADRLPWWPGFGVFRVLPLSIEGSKLLINKCSFDEGVKASFVGEMDELAATHGSFISNPLLITIMLLLYNDVAGRLPTKMNVFYSMTFDVLFFRHDTIKTGKWIRKRYSSLPLDDFRRLFSVFCALTYSENQYTFPLSDISEYLNVSIQYSDIDVESEDFRKDLLESVPMLQVDGVYCSFVHRSFQEHFTAQFLSNDAHIDFYSYIDRILQRQNTDSVLQRLLEINRGRFEKDWAIPYLTNMLTDLDQAAANSRGSIVISKIFGELVFYSDDAVIGLGVPRQQAPADAGLSVIEKMFMQPEEYEMLLAPISADVVQGIAGGTVPASSEVVRSSARNILRRRSSEQFSATLGFRLGPGDDLWASETSLFDLAIERVNRFRAVLQSLERSSHGRSDFRFSLFRR